MGLHCLTFTLDTKHSWPLALLTPPPSPPLHSCSPSLTLPSPSRPQSPLLNLVLDGFSLIWSIVNYIEYSRKRVLKRFEIVHFRPLPEEVKNDKSAPQNSIPTSLEPKHLSIQINCKHRNGFIYSIVFMCRLIATHLPKMWALWDLLQEKRTKAIQITVTIRILSQVLVNNDLFSRICVPYLRLLWKWCRVWQNKRWGSRQNTNTSGHRRCIYNKW